MATSGDPKISVEAALAPLRPNVIAELELYHEKVAELIATEYMEQSTTTFTVAAPDRPLLARGDRTMLDAVLGYYRKIDVLQDRGTLVRVVTALKRAAHERGSDEGRQMIERLDGVLELREQARSTSGLLEYRTEEVGGQRQVPPSEAVDLFMSHVFHGDNPVKEAAFKSHGGWESAGLLMLLHGLLGAMIPLIRGVDEFVARVLASPTLVADRSEHGPP